MGLKSEPAVSSGVRTHLPTCSGFPIFLPSRISARNTRLALHLTETGVALTTSGPVTEAAVPSIAVSVPKKEESNDARKGESGSGGGLQGLGLVVFQRAESASTAKRRESRDVCPADLPVLYNTGHCKVLEEF